MINPFHIRGYHGPGTFCDREIETEKIINAIENQRDITMTSLRKMGKTGLIEHALAKLRKKKKSFEIFYIDIYHTEDLSGFLDKLGSEIINKEQSFTSKLRTILKQVISSISPTLSYDTLTGAPNLSFNFANQTRKEQTLADIFGFLAEFSKTKPVIIAIDEFQQIAKYPETNTEALLRGIIQQLNNVNFIFAGSDTTMMTTIFNDAKRPFYQSTQMMHIDSIPDDKYIPFIKKHMKKGGKKIQNGIIEYILDEARRHTFYVQYFCNRAYSSPYQEISPAEIKEIYAGILEENESFYISYRDLVSNHQWRFLSALAKEDGYNAITSGEFIKKYNLTNSSTIRRSAKALIDKQLIYKKDGYYYIYDPFFSRWLSKY